MIKPHIINTFLYCALFFIILSLCSGFRESIKSPVAIILKDERIPVTPKEFYIADVTDERENRTGIGWLTPASTAVSKHADLYAVDLLGGGAFAIKQFINHNLPHDPSLRAVIINLKKINLVENPLAGGKVEGKVEVVMSFVLVQPYSETLKLIDYDGKAGYTRDPGLAQDVEPVLRHVIENGLVYLNTWMNLQAGKNIKLAKAVKVSVADYREPSGVEGDSVYYSADRPLTWNDFQSAIYSDRYDAEVFPVIGYNEYTKVVDGIINIRIEIKACLPKSACWVRDGSRSDYTLNHEQRHFDIVKIIAGQFAKKLLKEDLPVSNFDGPINVDYLEAMTDMNKLQKQYDHETVHGTDHFAQEKWNNIIDKKLTEFVAIK